MKKLWSRIAALALVAGFAATLNAQEPASPVPADSLWLTSLENASAPAPAPRATRAGLVGANKAICQPG
jgi:hypothetical protein